MCISSILLFLLCSSFTSTLSVSLVAFSAGTIRQTLVHRFTYIRCFLLSVGSHPTTVYFFTLIQEICFTFATKSSNYQRSTDNDCDLLIKIHCLHVSLNLSFLLFIMFSKKQPISLKVINGFPTKQIVFVSDIIILSIFWIDAGEKPRFNFDTIWVCLVWTQATKHLE